MLTRTTLAAMLIGLTLAMATIGSADEPAKIVVMPVESADKSLTAGVAVLEEIIGDYFKDNRAAIIISSEQREALAGEVTGNRLRLIRTVSAKMGGDQALLFALLRYRDRVGDQYSVKDPASLAFDFKLINSGDGRVVCSGQFDETQQSLTENIFNLPRAFKRGFKWLTVKELAIEAVRDRFATCPALTATSPQ